MTLDQQQNDAYIFTSEQDTRAEVQAGYVHSGAA